MKPKVSISGYTYFYVNKYLYVDIDVDEDFKNIGSYPNTVTVDNKDPLVK